jgi:hypothetical protein
MEPESAERATDELPAMSDQVILEDVPRVGFDVHMSPFPGSLYACLEVMGAPCDYDYLMGVSGAAFRRLWNRDDGGNVDLSYLGDGPFRRAFEALGYDWCSIPAQKEAMIEAAKESIDRGVPAISFGIIGPPEAGVVAGYGRGGEVLYGWSYFQEGRERYYQRDDWFETMDRNAGKGLIVIGDRSTARPSERDTLIASLEWAIDLERTAQRPGLPDHVAGLAAYDAWADALEVDADYPADDAELLGVRLMVYADQCTMLYERHSAARYLRRMAEVAPDAADYLNTAAALYEEAADRGDELWPWGNEMGRVAQQGLSDAQARREFAAHVRAAKAVEERGVARLERALATLR